MASKNLTKKELIELLKCAKTSSQRNKAVKLLKRFDPVPNYDYDEYGQKSEMELQELNYLAAYVCFRCGKVKQAQCKVHWRIPEELSTAAGGASSSSAGGESKEEEGGAYQKPLNTRTTKKVICTSCYNQLLEADEIRKLRKQHQKAGLVAKGMGFGLTDETKR